LVYANKFDENTLFSAQERQFRRQKNEFFSYKTAHEKIVCKKGDFEMLKLHFFST